MTTETGNDPRLAEVERLISDAVWNSRSNLRAVAEDIVRWVDQTTIPRCDRWRWAARWNGTNPDWVDYEGTEEDCRAWAEKWNGVVLRRPDIHWEVAP